MKAQWIPLVGQFDTSNSNDLVFRGGLRTLNEDQGGAQEQRRSPELGIALSNLEFTDGSISAEVVFKEIEEASACELIISYDTGSRYHLAAGIPHFKDTMFAIREWTGSRLPDESGPRWVAHAIVGDRRNLLSNHKYILRVERSGSWVHLFVNGVFVVTASVPVVPTAQGRVGIWCMGSADIQIGDLAVASAKPRAFVVMQFSDPYNEVYSEVIRLVCGQFGLDPVRVDEVYGPGLIIRDVVDQIIRAQVVIAEITPVNANVYFEVGYALALEKPIILLAKKETKLPFDIAGLRVLFYEDSIAGRSHFERNLKRHLVAIFGSRSESIKREAGAI